MNKSDDPISRASKLDFVRQQIRQYSGPRKEINSDSMFILCPFHSEKTPSFRLFYGSSSRSPGFGSCYGCGAKHHWDAFAPLLGLQPYKVGKPLEHFASPINLNVDDESPVDPDYYTTELPANKKWRSIPTNLLIDIGCKWYHSDRYKQKLVFLPVNVGGELKGFIRAFVKKDPTGERPSYLNASGSWSKTYGLFPFDYSVAMGKGTIVLVEGPRDALRLIQMGIPAIALLGTQSWSKKKAELLEIHGVQRVIVFMDGDAAGIKATKLVLNDLQILFETRVLKLWSMAGSFYQEWKKLPTKKERDELKYKLWDPGNCPDWILRKLKDKYF